MFHPPPGPDDEERISEKPIATPKQPIANSDSILPDGPMAEHLYQCIIDCFDEGKSKNEVITIIAANGYSQEQAETIIDDAARWRYKNADISRPIDISNIAGSGSNANMWIGGAICLIGIVVTVGSCMAAGEGGGRYTIAYGAIIWGAIQFFRGMSQSNQQ